MENPIENTIGYKVLMSALMVLVVIAGIYRIGKWISQDDTSPKVGQLSSKTCEELQADSDAANTRFNALFAKGLDTNESIHRMTADAIEMANMHC